MFLKNSLTLWGYVPSHQQRNDRQSAHGKVQGGGAWEGSWVAEAARWTKETASFSPLYSSIVEGFLQALREAGKMIKER